MILVVCSLLKVIVIAVCNKAKAFFVDVFQLIHDGSGAKRPYSKAVAIYFILFIHNISVKTIV